MTIRRRTLPVGWYPGSGQECQSELAAFVAGVKPLPTGTTVYGGVMPHAGWYFSGRLAARVFYLAAQASQPQVVCIFGGHLGGNSPPLLVQEDASETPLGDLPMATTMFAPLQQKIACAPEYPGDNTIEIQLPMVKYFFPQAKLLALRVPHSQQAIQLGQAVAQVAQELNLTLLTFGSSDLTHYGPNYGWAPKGSGAPAVKWVKEVNDKQYVDRALNLDAPGVLFFPLYAVDGAAITNNAVLAGLENTVLMSSDGLLSADFIAQTQPASEGMYLSGPASTEESQEFLQEYQTRYGESPIASYHLQGYDAAMMLLDAVEKVAVRSGGSLFVGRQALREALFATRGMEGLSGPLNCIETGDCAQPNIAIFQVSNGEFREIYP